MPCFYCGKPVSVLRKLTDPDFCCDEHRQRYHELSRLALERLMSASTPSRKPKHAEAPQPAPVAEPQARPSEATGHAEELRMPPPAGPKEVARGQNKDLVSCFIGPGAASFPTAIALPGISPPVWRNAGLLTATWLTAGGGAAIAHGGSLEAGTVWAGGAKIHLPSGPSSSAAWGRLEAGSKPLEAKAVRAAASGSPGARALVREAVGSQGAIRTPAPSLKATLGLAPATKLREPGAVVGGAFSRQGGATGRAGQLRLPAMTAGSSPRLRSALPAPVEPTQPSPAPGSVRAASPRMPALGAAPAAPRSRGPQTTGVGVSGTLALTSAPVTVIPVPSLTPVPILVAAAAPRSGTAGGGARGAILEGEAVELTPRLIRTEEAARAAPAARVGPEVAFPRGRICRAGGPALSSWRSAGPPQPVTVTSLSVGSGSALAVSVVLPSVGQYAKIGQEGLAATPAAVIPGPELSRGAPEAAVSGANFTIPGPELTARAIAAPSAGWVLATSGFGLPELRPVVDEAGIRVESPASPAFRLAPSVPKGGRTTGMGALGLAPPALAPAPVPKSGASAGLAFSAGTFPILAADVPRPVAVGRTALSSAGCAPSGYCGPQIIPAKASGTFGFRPGPMTVSFPAIRVTALPASLGTAECGWPVRLLPEIARPEAAGDSAGWLSGAVGISGGKSGLGLESAGLRRGMAARPRWTAEPVRTAPLARAWADPATGITTMLPGGVPLGRRAEVMSGLAELRPLVPHAIRATDGEGTEACLAPKPPRPAWPESVATLRAAYTFARYGERDPGPKPQAGPAEPVALGAEPLWRTRARRPVGVISPAIVEFVAPPVPPVWIQLLNVWRGIPPAVRGAVALAALVIGVSLLIWAAAGEAITARLEQRAAIELQEDFREGLRRWMGRPGWAESWKRQPAGFVEVSQLALWRPTRKLSDYQLEFLGQLSGRTLGWVFRAGDLENYYSMRLAVLKPGPLPAVALVRSVVVAGREQEKVQVPLRVRIQQGAPIRVRLLVRGDGFTTWIGDQLADYWRDDRFRQGAIGFYAEAGDRAQLFWVKVTHQNDFLGKLCAYLAPSRREED